MKSPNIIFDKVAITNFKAWKKETFFPLESINLIFGPNSSGKSSLFQALLLLAESRIFTPTFKLPFSPFNQLKLVNSNTRYLHPIQKVISENILSRFSKKFSHVFLVNSGSEANELALRLAKAYTGSKEFITFDHGYHGNTCLLYTSPSPRDLSTSRMPSSA